MLELKITQTTQSRKSTYEERKQVRYGTVPKYLIQKFLVFVLTPSDELFKFFNNRERDKIIEMNQRFKVRTMVCPKFIK